MKIVNIRRNSSRFWLFWPFGLGAIAVGWTAAWIISQSGLAWPGNWTVAAAVLVAYIFFALLILEVLGVRLEWSISLVDDETVRVDVYAYAFGKYVILRDGEVVQRKRSLLLTDQLGFPLGTHPVHQALLTARAYLWPIRLSLDVDGHRLVDV